MNLITVNIVIPVYNEEQFIYNVICEIADTKTHFEQNFRVIIIDDCSNDNTSFEIKKAVDNFKNKLEIICLSNIVNSGKGHSLRKGFEMCLPGIVIIQDADLEYSPSEYKKLLDPIFRNKTDVVYGSRFQGSEPKRVLYYTHYLANRWLTTLSNLFTGLNLSDMETCYKVFKTELLDKIKLKENRFGIEPEITAKLSRIKKVRFVEIGISYYGRTYSEGKKIKLKDAFVTLWCIFKYNLWAKK